jgi:hypothetical protein
VLISLQGHQVGYETASAKAVRMMIGFMEASHLEMMEN